MLIRLRPLGALRMRDGGAADETIIGVPADDVDPTYADLREITDLPQIERDRIEAFFRVYKDLPAGGTRIETPGLGRCGRGAGADARRGGRVRGGPLSPRRRIHCARGSAMRHPQ